MSQRQTWTFSHKAADVLAAARRQLAYHERKTAWPLTLDYDDIVFFGLAEHQPLADDADDEAPTAE